MSAAINRISHARDAVVEGPAADRASELRGADRRIGRRRDSRAVMIRHADGTHYDRSGVAESRAMDVWSCSADSRSNAKCNARLVPPESPLPTNPDSPRTQVMADSSTFYIATGGARQR